jgi:broad specificity phosphatase PhoE
MEFDVGVLDGRRADEDGAWETYQQVRRQWEAGCEEAGFEQGESLADAGRRLSALLGSLPHDPEGPIVLVGHGMLFMTLLWLFCENRGSTLQDNYMGRGHQTVLTRLGPHYRIERFNIAPDESDGRD